jgi:hypothetical protein
MSKEISTEQKVSETPVKYSLERNEIDRAYVRTYSDSGQVTAYVEWSDGSRTKGEPSGVHMSELFRRAKRDGIEIESETW